MTLLALTCKGVHSDITKKLPGMFNSTDNDKRNLFNLDCLYLSNFR